MQIVLERGSIDKPRTFDIGLNNSFFILVYSPNTYACKGVFNPNIPILQPNCAEGLHFSAFHCTIGHRKYVHMLFLNYVYTSYDHKLFSFGCELQ